MSARTLGCSGCGRRGDSKALPPPFSRLNVRSRTHALAISRNPPTQPRSGNTPSSLKTWFEQVHLGSLLVHHCKSSTALFEQFSFQVATQRTAPTRPSFARIWTHREDYADGGRQATPSPSLTAPPELNLTNAHTYQGVREGLTRCFRLLVSFCLSRPPTRCTLRLTLGRWYWTAVICILQHLRIPWPVGLAWKELSTTLVQLQANVRLA